VQASAGWLAAADAPAHLACTIVRAWPAGGTRRHEREAPIEARRCTSEKLPTFNFLRDRPYPASSISYSALMSGKKAAPKASPESSAVGL